MDSVEYKLGQLEGKINGIGGDIADIKADLRDIRNQDVANSQGLVRVQTKLESLIAKSESKLSKFGMPTIGLLVLANIMGVDLSKFM